MGEKEDKEKAEKLAAAKKRVAQLQKKKKAAGGGAGAADKTSKDKPKKEDASKNDEQDVGTADDMPDDKGHNREADTVDGEAKQVRTAPGETADADEELFNDAIKAASATSTGQDATSAPDPISAPSGDQDVSAVNRAARQSSRQPSVSIQSKLRSTSFRDNGPLSPAATSTSISRIEELEKENKRLAKEAEDHENRWRKVENELEELREQTAEKPTPARDSPDDEVSKLRAEIASLKRRTSASRRESTPGTDDSDNLKAELENKDSTIADMQLEISRLRGQLSTQTQGCETNGEQIAALQTTLSSTEGKLRATERELSDTKQALSRASEKAVVEGTERTSKDTKIRALESELQEAQSQRDELTKKAEHLEKKVEAINKLHKEAESRTAVKLASSEALAREIPALRARIEKSESENARLREKHKRVMSGDGGGEGMDELEDEEREKLERRIRELEGHIFDLQRGLWRDKRSQMQTRGEAGSTTSIDAAEDFDEVDLSGSGQPSRRRSMVGAGAQQPGRHSGFAQVLNSGLAAFRANTTSPDRHPNRPRTESLLQEFDDDDAFDEQAFAHAQREEEARKMVEHVREVKKGLKQWVGWRLDLVDARRAGVGIGLGDIFEV